MKLDDLTIFLKAVDKTKGVFGKVTKRLDKMGKVGGIITKIMGAIGAAALAGFTAAVAGGRTFNDELTRMSNSINTTTGEADKLYKIIKEGAPATNIDNLGEGLLTLKEGFFDAHAESGPLFDLIKDFGADIDLGLDTPREQLIAFLEVMQELPSDTDRAGAAVANFGGEDAKSIIKIANDAKTLHETIQLLKGVGTLDSFISDIQLQNMEEAKDASNGLDAAWETLSTTAYSLVSPAFELLSKVATKVVEAATTGLRKMGELVGVFDTNDLLPAKTVEQANARLADFSEKITELERKRDEMRKLTTGPGNVAAKTTNLDAQIKELYRQNEATLAVKKQLEAQNTETEQLIAEQKAQREKEQAVAAAQTKGSEVAKATRSAFQNTLESLNTSTTETLFDIMGFDIDELIAKQAALPDLEAKQIRSLMRLDISADQKQQIAELVKTDFANISNAISEQLDVEFLGANLGAKTLDSLRSTISENNATFRSAPIETLTFGTDAANDSVVTLEDSLNSLSGTVGKFADAAGKSNAKTFKSFQTLQIALSTVAAISAAIKAANASSGGGPLAAFAAYASVIGALLGAVSQIKAINMSSSAKPSASIGGGATSAPSNAAIGGTQQAPQQNTQNIQRTVNVNVQGDGNLSADFARQIVEAINENDSGDRIRGDRVAA